MKQVAWNKSRLLLKIILQDAQMLQLFPQMIETESIHKSYSNAKLGGLGSEI